MTTSPDDDWNEPDPQFHDEHATCLHGVTPRSDCDWCGEQTDND